MKVTVGKLLGLLGGCAFLFGCATAPAPTESPQSYEPAEVQPVPAAKSPIKVYTCNYSPDSAERR